MVVGVHIEDTMHTLWEARQSIIRLRDSAGELPLPNLSRKQWDSTLDYIEEHVRVLELLLCRELDNLAHAVVQKDAAAILRHVRHKGCWECDGTGIVREARHDPEHMPTIVIEVVCDTLIDQATFIVNNLEGYCDES